MHNSTHSRSTHSRSATDKSDESRDNRHSGPQKYQKAESSRSLKSSTPSKPTNTRNQTNSQDAGYAKNVTFATERVISRLPRSQSDQTSSDNKSTAPSIGFVPSLAFNIANSMLGKSNPADGRLPKQSCIKLLQFAADRGHVEAMCELGVLLCRYGASRIDKRKGFEYVKQAARKQHPEAQFQLAGFYHEGLDCVQQDDDQCVHWITLAASAGHGQATEQLAKAYDRGELGLAINHHRAEEVRERLADTQTG